MGEERLFSKLTLLVNPTEPGPHFDFLERVGQAVSQFLCDTGHDAQLESGDLHLSWCDDAPLSIQVEVTATFRTLSAFDAVADLSIHLKKQDWTVGSVLGY